MEKKIIILLLLGILLINCKDNKKEQTLSNQKNVKDSSSVKKEISVKKEKLSLIDANDFKKLLNKIPKVSHTRDKHFDIRTNNTFLLDRLFDLSDDKFQVKTTSYEYKKDLVFYLHTIKHTNDSISIKSYLENAQGKYTEGYLGIRVLIFAMKNNKEANFIDIPANWNYIELKEELLDILYKKIDSDIILCYRAKKCIYKDLRHQ